MPIHGLPAEILVLIATAERDPGRLAFATLDEGELITDPARRLYGEMGFEALEKRVDSGRPTETFPRRIRLPTGNQNDRVLGPVGAEFGAKKRLFPGQESGLQVAEFLGDLIDPAGIELGVGDNG